jgi:hypothetical protein
MIKDPSTGHQLVYDAFLRDGWLYIVSTFYNIRDRPLTITVNGLTAEVHGFNEPEPVCYYRVRCTEIPTHITINTITYPFPSNIDTLLSPQQPGGIAIATLFKGDHMFIPNMLAWYRKQGATAFYLYYNGDTLPDGLPTGPDIHYRTWNFRYWNSGGMHGRPETGWAHAAQMAFLTTVRLRYFPYHSWIGLVDIDELVVPVDGIQLSTYLEKVPANKLCVMFQNHWAIQNNNSITYSEKAEGWESRTKCFYRGSYTGLCGIHHPKHLSPASILNTLDLRMLHIVNQTHPDRISLIRNPKLNLTL